MEISLKEHAGERTREPRQKDQPAAPKQKPRVREHTGLRRAVGPNADQQKDSNPDKDGIKPGSSR